jgi:hypothetical protein
MSHLTKQEQLMLSLFLGLLLAGWAVKAYLSASPDATIAAPAKH